MKIIHSDDNRMHFPQGELFGGELVTPFERPSRVEYILGELKKRGHDDISPPGRYAAKPVKAIHDGGFLRFLETAWDQWQAAGYKGEILPTVFPARRMQLREPRQIDGKVGYYALAIETAITPGTWQAARSSCAVAQSAQRLVSGGEQSAFALCRPPGHHAARDLYGGYCFLNNAAIAAQMFIDDGAAKVAILDVDFHHGNGTQDIFYDRDDVLFCSLHGDPQHAFPHFLGYKDETGQGRGEGFNRNYPMPPGTDYSRWSRALKDAIKHIRAHGPDALVVSLGVDAYKDDPISFFKLDHDDFTDCGRQIAKLKLPTVFVMEGGYAVAEIGVNTVNLLEGYMGA